uniref:Laminin subunit gamma-3 n=1 Tax=Anas platyrhynchos TaxID=8839 RepID=A0A8B9ZF43_ANAPL
MAQPGGLCLLALLVLGFGVGGSPACYDPRGLPRHCMPVFENAAFGRAAWATNTCGSPPEDYCQQMGARHASQLCQRCDAADPRLHHNASLLTDFHSQEESTWWQSQSMAFGIQHPNSVNITLRLGKAYEITYVRLKFHTSRPESFAIYKRGRADGPWVPFQYYSASCHKTYGKQPRHYLRPGEDEQVAFCTDEFSDISPLSGGNVAFSTLEGRPSAYNFDGSPALQEWVTVTDLLISLNRLNTFGDDIFKDPKVLQSYYYAISDFSVGGRCKCNGHASECAPDETGRLACVCQHNTAGIDCERCQPFYQDRPWARGTAEAANECLPCNCSGRSEECFYDPELFRSSGHGGHCRHCRDNTAGPRCERCRQNHYRWEPRAACQPCHCHPAGAWGAAGVGTCDPNTGHCACKERVEGHLCNRSAPWHQGWEWDRGPFPGLGSVQSRASLLLWGIAASPAPKHSPLRGDLQWKSCGVAPYGGWGCIPLDHWDWAGLELPPLWSPAPAICFVPISRCQPGWFNLQPHNPAGCTSCFCYWPLGCLHGSDRLRGDPRALRLQPRYQDKKWGPWLLRAFLHPVVLLGLGTAALAHYRNTLKK